MADDDDPFAGGANPFGNIPLFGDLAKALSGQGPLNWDAARQFAHLAAEGVGSAANVDPSVRIALADLGRIAELHVRDVTGMDPQFPEVTPVTPGTWAQRTLEAYRPLFTELATSLGKRPTLPTAEEPGTGVDEFGDGGDQMMAMMASLSALMAPSMMGMGTRRVNVEPTPSSDTTSTSPPWLVATWRTIANPSPVPPVSRLRAWSTR